MNEQPGGSALSEDEPSPTLGLEAQGPFGPLFFLHHLAAFVRDCWRRSVGGVLLRRAMHAMERDGFGQRPR